MHRKLVTGRDRQQFNFHIDDASKVHIEAAAHRLGLNVSSFLRMAALRFADEVLARPKATERVETAVVVVGPNQASVADPKPDEIVTTERKTNGVRRIPRAAAAARKASR